MDCSTNNDSRERTVPVHYIVVCGKPTPDGETYPFKYSEQAPVSLCEPHGNDKPRPDPNETGKFITAVIERHHLEILHRRPWQCISCNEPAKELLHSAVPFLSPGPDVLPDFEPTIWDTAAPICRSGGACDRHAEELVHTFARNSIGEDKFEADKTCDWCGGKTDIKMCAGCKTLG
jgi:hypothetical protein